MLPDQILRVDAVEGMKALPKDSIPMTLTSPPYDDLRLYGGHAFDDQQFRAVAEELWRVTMPGGVVVWVVADAIIDGSETCNSARQKLFFMELGFNVHHTMIMARSGSRWPSVVRHGDSLEYAFVMSKGRPRSIYLRRDRPNTNVGALYRGRRWLGLERDRPRPTDRPVAEWGVRTAVWVYEVGSNRTTRDRYAFEHPALMPERMAEDHILSWSRPGDLVFDPMSGAATTCKMALLNGRRYLGFEVHEPYYRLALRRMRDAHAEHKRRLSDWLIEPFPGRSATETLPQRPARDRLVGQAKMVYGARPRLRAGCEEAADRS